MDGMIRGTAPDSPTPSDDGPWATYWDEDENQPHVVPGFGRAHELSMRCWCHPVQDRSRYAYDGAAVMHNVAQ